MPHPDILRKYDELLPGAADRILKQAENQTSHRIDIEKKVIQNNIINSRLGLIFGFIIGILGIGGGIYLTVLGFDVFGPILGTGTLASLIYSFIYGTNSRKNERIEKYKKSIK